MDLREQRVAGEHQEDLTSEPAAVVTRQCRSSAASGLASEHPFPAAVEDASHAVRWLGEHGYPAERVVIAGGSSADGLTLATLLKLRQDGSALPAGAVAISPWCDLACTGASLEENAEADLSVTKAALQRMAGQYPRWRPGQGPARVAAVRRPGRAAAAHDRRRRRRGAAR
jgi:acetyl esterase/lipase